MRDDIRRFGHLRGRADGMIQAHRAPGLPKRPVELTKRSLGSQQLAKQ
jgi:hypothetical protein